MLKVTERFQPPGCRGILDARPASRTAKPARRKHSRMSTEVPSNGTALGQHNGLLGFHLDADGTDLVSDPGGSDHQVDVGR